MTLSVYIQILPVVNPCAVALQPMEGHEHLCVDHTSFHNNEGDSIPVVVEDTKFGLIARLPRENGGRFLNVPRSVERAIEHWRAEVVITDPELRRTLSFSDQVHPKGHSFVRLRHGKDHLYITIRAGSQGKLRFLIDRCVDGTLKRRHLLSQREERELFADQDNERDRAAENYQAWQARVTKPTRPSKRTLVEFDHGEVAPGLYDAIGCCAKVVDFNCRTFAIVSGSPTNRARFLEAVRAGKVSHVPLSDKRRREAYDIVHKLMQQRRAAA